MKKETWKKRIKKQCIEAGTYKPYFDSTIDMLASVMENRDYAQKSYEDSGRQPVVLYTNKSGNTNIVKNPALVVVDNLNKTALEYWKELGLTPASLKRINESALKGGKKGGSSLGEVLKNLEI